MMELLEDVFIRCSRCGKVTGIHKEDFDFESYVYDRGDNKPVEYPPTSEIMAELHELEMQITESLAELEGML